MELRIANCPKCGKVFTKTFGDVCPECQKEVERQYELCAKYLRENRKATIHELSEDTGVSIPQITKFIREGRISLHDNPNLGYPCSTCGTIIRQGTVCKSCQESITREIAAVQEDDQIKQRIKQEESRRAIYRIKEGKKK